MASTWSAPPSTDQPAGLAHTETNLTVVPDYVLRPPAGFYRGLNPATKMVIALCTAALAFVLRGWLAPIVALGVVGGTVAGARLGRAFLPFVLATRP